MNAVITGDLINSTKLGAKQRKELVIDLQAALKIWKDGFKFKAEFFRGDSFQCFLSNPKFSLRVALILKTYIRGFSDSGSSASRHWDPKYDTRIAIGIGEALIDKKLSQSGGDAFILSGRLLDSLKGNKQSFGIATADGFKAELETSAILIDAIISKTTSMQCEVINLKLLGYNEYEIAKKLKINQSAINQRSRSGNWNAFLSIVERFEKIY